MRATIFAFLFLFYLALFQSQVLATSDPLTTSNNKIGIHILETSELPKAAEMINHNGGQWGYVTIPLRSNDKDKQKWDNFMLECRKLKIIPIIRLASNMTDSGWTKPTKYELVDFANFLNDLYWPVKNRYIIVFNEPNHANEWQGMVNPGEYAEVLVETSRLFKERNDDFFILPAGLDVAAPNDLSHMNWRTYILAMNAINPKALQSIDGWNSHSYPNPGFSGSPSDRHDHSIVSYIYEKQLVENLIGKQLPVFITETGWSSQVMSDETAANFLKIAFESTWNNNSEIVAVTPFVLMAGDGPFQSFSLLNPDGSPKPQYLALKDMSKNEGKPEMDSQGDNPVLGAVIEDDIPASTTEGQIKTNLTKDKWQKLWEWLK